MGTNHVNYDEEFEKVDSEKELPLIIVGNEKSYLS
jgi:hypothetical protein